MNLIADILLLAATFGAAFYCFILSKRLKKFNSLELGVGGAVSVLSTQVKDLKDTLEAAQTTAENSAKTLTEITNRAEDVSKKIEIQIAALNDLSKVDSTAGVVEPQTVNDESSNEPMFIRHSGVA